MKTEDLDGLVSCCSITNNYLLPWTVISKDVCVSSFNCERRHLLLQPGTTTNLQSIFDQLKTRNLVEILFFFIYKVYTFLYSGAWIITGGTHAGVMKHVGQAVRDHSLSSSMQGKIVTIGVATWGIIHNRDALVDSQV